MGREGCDVERGTGGRTKPHVGKTGKTSAVVHGIFDELSAGRTIAPRRVRPIYDMISVLR